MQRTRKTGGEAAYPPAADYTYINSGLTQSATPSIKGGSSCSMCNTGGGSRRFGGYFADQKQNDAYDATPDTFDGGARRRARRGRRGGAPVELTAFISALALLGARLLADKNSSFNLFSSNEQRQEQPAGLYQEQVGGVRRRPAAKKPAAKKAAAKKAAPKRRPAAKY